MNHSVDAQQHGLRDRKVERLGGLQHSRPARTCSAARSADRREAVRDGERGEQRTGCETETADLQTGSSAPPGAQAYSSDASV